jgi:hypothetical protein
MSVRGPDFGSKPDGWPSGTGGADRIILLLIVHLMLIGCGGAMHRQWVQAGANVPARCQLDFVPFYSQKAFQCGPAALAMALTWSGVSADPDTLAPEVFTASRKGSLQSAIIGSARRHGRVAYPVSGRQTLLAEVCAGHPVIVLQNLGLSWYPVWHYAVVVGYDAHEGMMILHSGVIPYKRVSIRVFEKTWARSDHWGLLVLPPARFPATATEDAYISAVLGLEKAGQWQGAVEGYKNALTRWPDNLAAYMGLGNSYYAGGDTESAEGAFRVATHRFPTHGSTFNNLAHVLWKRGKQQAALDAARRAVELGGPLVSVYRKTLEEIQASANGQRPCR